MDPLLPIPQPTNKPPPKPTEKYTAFDIAAYSGGGAAFIATQLYSRSYPHLAAEVAANTIGPRMALGKGQIGIRPTTGPLLLLPQPFGFQDPHKYGMGPNYMYDLESRARSYGMGLEHLTPPPATLLHNLPDNDPRVRYEYHKHRAEEQLRDLLILTRNSSVEELLDLLEIASSPDAGKVFFEPPEIADQLKLLATARAGGREEFQRAKAAHNVTNIDRFLPAAGTQPTRVPSPLEGLSLSTPPASVAGVASLDPLASQRPPAGTAPPLSTPPTNNQQREAMGRAPELLRELVTERSDP